MDWTHVKSNFLLHDIIEENWKESNAAQEESS